jgi:hypothetical protein
MLTVIGGAPRMLMKVPPGEAAHFISGLAIENVP